MERKVGNSSPFPSSRPLMTGIPESVLSLGPGWFVGCRLKRRPGFFQRHRAARHLLSVGTWVTLRRSPRVMSEGAEKWALVWAAEEKNTHTHRAAYEILSVLLIELIWVSSYFCTVSCSRSEGDLMTGNKLHLLNKAPPSPPSTTPLMAGQYILPCLPQGFMN